MGEIKKQDCVNSLAQILSHTLECDEANAAALALISRYGNLDAILSFDESRLCEVGGFGMNSAILLKLVGYVNARSVIEAAASKENLDAIELMEYIKALFLGLTVETVYLILFDSNGRIISTEYMGEGTVAASDVYPRKLLECAVGKRAHSVILAHNHPHGSVVPSKDDLAVTKKLESLFMTVGIGFREHYIVADGDISAINTSEA